MYTVKYRFSVPKRQLPHLADLIINRLRWEGVVKRQHAVFDNDEDIQIVLSVPPSAKPKADALQHL